MPLRSLLIIAVMSFVAHSVTIAGPVDAPDDRTDRPEAPTVLAVPNLLTLNEDQAALLSPLLQQVRAALAAQQAETAALEAKIAATSDAQEVRVLERRVAAAKLQGEIRIFEIQAEFARREGRVSEAEAFDGLARSLRNPAPRKPAAVLPSRQEVSR